MPPASPRIEPAPVARGPFGVKALLLTLAFLAAALAVATYPTITSLSSSLPDRQDSFQHLWIMRWYKSCLLEGKLPFNCPDIQYPAGSPFGSFSPLHLQALVYIPLSYFVTNDALCYNVIWIAAFLFTGIGTTLLVWHVVGDRMCAAFGGLSAMLAAPMLAHSHGHTELITLGGFPLFLLAWMRFVDRPGWGALLAATGCYTLLAMSAAYYMVYAVFPAVLYVVLSMAWGGRSGLISWFRERAPWFLGMVALTVPILFVLFASHLWSVMHGHGLGRDRAEFDHSSVGLRSYLLPSFRHFLSFLVPESWRVPSTGGPSYLGVMTLFLMAYAAFARVSLRRSGYFWAALALAVILSFGSTKPIGPWVVTLPASWLWSVFPPFRFTRDPSRFNLFAGVLAAVLASAGLRHLLARLPNPRIRAAVFGLVATIAIADLSTVPFWRGTLRAMPGAYAFVQARDPHARILEVPYLGAGGSDLNAACFYWQSVHGLTTSAGFSGHGNYRLESMIGYGCPFSGGNLSKPRYAADPGHFALDLIPDLDYLGYTWVYLTANKFDYVILHQWKDAITKSSWQELGYTGPVRLKRMKELMEGCKIYEDDESIVYDPSKLEPPTRPFQVLTEDWPLRSLWQDRWSTVLAKTARVVVYSPDSNMDLVMVLDAGSARPKAQSVRLLEGDRELGCWDVEPDAYLRCYSKPFRLSKGLHDLTIESTTQGLDGADAKAVARDSKLNDHIHVARASVLPATWFDPIAERNNGDKTPARVSRR